jgi:hypothetical protein
MFNHAIRSEIENLMEDLAHDGVRAHPGIFPEGLVARTYDLLQKNMDGVIDGNSGVQFALLYSGSMIASLVCWNEVVRKDELKLLHVGRLTEGHAWILRSMVATAIYLFGREPVYERIKSK